MDFLVQFHLQYDLIQKFKYRRVVVIWRVVKWRNVIWRDVTEPLPALVNVICHYNIGDDLKSKTTIFSVRNQSTILHNPIN